MTKKKQIILGVGLLVVVAVFSFYLGAKKNQLSLEKSMARAEEEMYEEDLGGCTDGEFDSINRIYDKCRKTRGWGECTNEKWENRVACVLGQENF